METFFKTHTLYTETVSREYTPSPLVGVEGCFLTPPWEGRKWCSPVWMHGLSGCGGRQALSPGTMLGHPTGAFTVLPLSPLVMVITSVIHFFSWFLVHCCPWRPGSNMGHRQPVRLIWVLLSLDGRGFLCPGQLWCPSGITCSTSYGWCSTWLILCVCVFSCFRHVWLFVTPWTVACQTPLLCPWDSPGKNTGVGCHFLLQRICLTQGSNPHLLNLLNCMWFLYWWARGSPTGLILSVLNKCLEFGLVGLLGRSQGTQTHRQLWVPTQIGQDLSDPSSSSSLLPPLPLLPCEAGGSWCWLPEVPCPQPTAF